MGSNVSWVLAMAMKPGELDTFKTLMDEMVEGTNSEAATLNYEWYISEDGGTVHIYERYADSDALVAHVTGFLEKWAGRFLAAADPVGFTVYGEPDAAAQEILAAFGPTYMGTLGGFSR